MSYSQEDLIELPLFASIVSVRSDGALGKFKFKVTKRITLIGRNPDLVDVRILRPEVSQVHAKLTVDEENKIWIENLSKTNGTLVNGQKIAEPYQLDNNVRFSIASKQFEVQYAPEGSTAFKVNVDLPSVGTSKEYETLNISDFRKMTAKNDLKPMIPSIASNQVPLAMPSVASAVNVSNNEVVRKFSSLSADLQQEIKSFDNSSLKHVNLFTESVTKLDPLLQQEIHSFSVDSLKQFSWKTGLPSLDQSVKMDIDSFDVSSLCRYVWNASIPSINDSIAEEIKSFDRISLKSKPLPPMLPCILSTSIRNFVPSSLTHVPSFAELARKLPVALRERIESFDFCILKHHPSFMETALRISADMKIAIESFDRSCLNHVPSFIEIANRISPVLKSEIQSFDIKSLKSIPSFTDNIRKMDQEIQRDIIQFDTSILKACPQVQSTIRSIPADLLESICAFDVSLLLPVPSMLETVPKMSNDLQSAIQAFDRKSLKTFTFSVLSSELQSSIKRFDLSILNHVLSFTESCPKMDTSLQQSLHSFDVSSLNAAPVLQKRKLEDGTEEAVEVKKIKLETLPESLLHDLQSENPSNRLHPLVLKPLSTELQSSIESFDASTLRSLYHKPLTSDTLRAISSFDISTLKTKEYQKMSNDLQESITSFDKTSLATPKVNQDEDSTSSDEIIEITEEQFYGEETEHSTKRYPLRSQSAEDPAEEDTHATRYSLRSRQTDETDENAPEPKSSRKKGRQSKSVTDAEAPKAKKPRTRRALRSRDQNTEAEPEVEDTEKKSGRKTRSKSKTSDKIPEEKPERRSVRKRKPTSHLVY